MNTLIFYIALWQCVWLTQFTCDNFKFNLTLNFRHSQIISVEGMHLTIISPQREQKYKSMFGRVRTLYNVTYLLHQPSVRLSEKKLFSDTTKGSGLTSFLLHKIHRVEYQDLQWKYSSSQKLQKLFSHTLLIPIYWRSPLWNDLLTRD